MQASFPFKAACFTTTATYNHHHQKNITVARALPNDPTLFGRVNRLAHQGASQIDFSHYLDLLFLFCSEVALCRGGQRCCMPLSLPHRGRVPLPLVSSAGGIAFGRQENQVSSLALCPKMKREIRFHLQMTRSVAPSASCEI